MGVYFLVFFFLSEEHKYNCLINCITISCRCSILFSVMCKWPCKYFQLFILKIKMYLSVCLKRAAVNFMTAFYAQGYKPLRSGEVVTPEESGSCKSALLAFFAKQKFMFICFVRRVSFPWKKSQQNENPLTMFIEHYCLGSAKKKGGWAGRKRHPSTQSSGLGSTCFNLTDIGCQPHLVFIFPRNSS